MLIFFGLCRTQVRTGSAFQLGKTRNNLLLSVTISVTARSGRMDVRKRKGYGAGLPKHVVALYLEQFTESVMQRMKNIV